MNPTEKKRGKKGEKIRKLITKDPFGFTSIVENQKQSRKWGEGIVKRKISEP